MAEVAELSGQDMYTHASRENELIDVNNPIAPDILYQNSFDPYATPVSFGEYSTDYLYDSNGGQESHVIDILYG